MLESTLLLSNTGKGGGYGAHPIWLGFYALSEGAGRGLGGLRCTGMESRTWESEAPTDRQTRRLWEFDPKVRHEHPDVNGYHAFCVGRHAAGDPAYTKRAFVQRLEVALEESRQDSEQSRRILEIARDRLSGHDRLEATLEEEQWWIDCRRCGARWRVGLDDPHVGFRRSGEGDEFCERNRRHNGALLYVGAIGGVLLVCGLDLFDRGHRWEALVVLLMAGCFLWHGHCQTRGGTFELLREWTAPIGLALKSPRSWVVMAIVLPAALLTAWACTVMDVGPLLTGFAVALVAMLVIAADFAWDCWRAELRKAPVKTLCTTAFVIFALLCWMGAFGPRWKSAVEFWK